MIELQALGRRLAEVRVLLGLSQGRFAELGGVKKGAQGLYESGQRAPDATYLLALLKNGVDAVYVLTGQHQEPQKNTEMSRFSASFMQLSQRERRAIEAMVAVLVGSPGDQLRRIIAGGSDFDILGAIDRAALTVAVHDDDQEYRHED